MGNSKVTYILSNVDKSIAFEWITEQLNLNKFQLSFILLNQAESYLHLFLQKKGIPSYQIIHRGKKSYPSSFFKVMQLLLKIQPNVVHTHLFDANLIGLTSAKLLGVKKRIYTRHHSTFHHDNYPNAVKYDRWSNKMATHIVAISKNVENILLQKESVPEEKISLIHHGFNFEEFTNVDKNVVLHLKIKYNIGNKATPIIGVIARYISLKGIQYIIPAFKQLLNNYPDAKLVLANATGPDENFIKENLRQLPNDSYIEILFEPNLFGLYQLFDVYVHVPTDLQIEAFGQTYVEALAAGVPSVYTLSGVAAEFIVNKKNALVVDYKNSKQIYEAILQLLENKPLRKKMITNGKESISQFNLDIFIRKLEKLYE